LPALFACQTRVIVNHSGLHNSRLDHRAELAGQFDARHDPMNTFESLQGTAVAHNDQYSGGCWRFRRCREKGPLVQGRGSKLRIRAEDDLGFNEDAVDWPRWSIEANRYCPFAHFCLRRLGASDSRKLGPP
jgi:hypothetical protein